MSVGTWACVHPAVSRASHARELGEARCCDRLRELCRWLPAGMKTSRRKGIRNALIWHASACFYRCGVWHGYGRGDGGTRLLAWQLTVPPGPDGSWLMRAGREYFFYSSQLVCQAAFFPKYRCCFSTNRVRYSLPCFSGTYVTHTRMIRKHARTNAPHRTARSPTTRASNPSASQHHNLNPFRRRCCRVCVYLHARSLGSLIRRASSCSSPAAGRPWRAPASTSSGGR